MPVRRITPARVKQLPQRGGGERADKMRNAHVFFFLFILAIIQMQVSSHKLLANDVLMLL